MWRRQELTKRAQNPLINGSKLDQSLKAGTYIQVRRRGWWCCLLPLVVGVVVVVVLVLLLLLLRLLTIEVQVELQQYGTGGLFATPGPGAYNAQVFSYFYLLKDLCC